MEQQLAAGESTEEEEEGLKELMENLSQLVQLTQGTYSKRPENQPQFRTPSFIMPLIIPPPIFFVHGTLW